MEQHSWQTTKIRAHGGHQLTPVGGIPRVSCKEFMVAFFRELLLLAVTKRTAVVVSSVIFCVNKKQNVLLLLLCLSSCGRFSPKDECA